jgi:nanoRNase/pAp phosphatase (c-di-AMP/oligoRNAs hydrolase)
MYSTKRPELPFQIFIANSPTRSDVDVGSLILSLKSRFEGFEGGGRQSVGGCNFKTEEQAQQVFDSIITSVK